MKRVDCSICNRTVGISVLAKFEKDTYECPVCRAKRKRHRKGVKEKSQLQYTSFYKKCL